MSSLTISPCQTTETRHGSSPAQSSQQLALFPHVEASSNRRDAQVLLPLNKIIRKAKLLYFFFLLLMCRDRKRFSPNTEWLDPALHHRARQFTAPAAPPFLYIKVLKKSAGACELRTAMMHATH